MTNDYGIKTGADADTDSDQDLRFTTKYSSLKIFKWGDASFTTNGSGVGSTTITHGLGYAPISMVYRAFTAQWDAASGLLPDTEYTNAFSFMGALNWYAGGVEHVDFDVDVDEDILTISDADIGLLSNNTTYSFRYYILVDLSQAFSDASNVSLTDDYGFKASKPGKDVLTAEEYDMAYSSKYKSLQYYPSHIQEATLTLPEMFASRDDESVQEAVYVDFEHDLGYAPFYLTYFGDDPVTVLTAAPFYAENSIDILNYSVSGFCDASRVRVYWWRHSALDDVINQTYQHFDEETITIKTIIFTEDLTGEASP